MLNAASSSCRSRSFPRRFGSPTLRQDSGSPEAASHHQAAPDRQLFRRPLPVAAESVAHVAGSRQLETFRGVARAPASSRAVDTPDPPVYLGRIEKLRKDGGLEAHTRFSDGSGRGLGRGLRAHGGRIHGGCASPLNPPRPQGVCDAPASRAHRPGWKDPGGRHGPCTATHHIRGVRGGSQVCGQSRVHGGRGREERAQ